mmetsp:Transcript_171107/g.548364  ORF Transcript_171107/g.548364 Transcript_171107/m.548364 type:complete len:200 (+) Transcript_171107:2983-3582(+)
MAPPQQGHLEARDHGDTRLRGLEGLLGVSDPGGVPQVHDPDRLHLARGCEHHAERPHFADVVGQGPEGSVGAVRLLVHHCRVRDGQAVQSRSGADTVEDLVHGLHELGLRDLWRRRQHRCELRRGRGAGGQAVHLRQDLSGALGLGPGHRLPDAARLLLHRLRRHAGAQHGVRRQEWSQGWTGLPDGDDGCCHGRGHGR